MEKQEILKRLDHTLLQQTAVWEQIKVLCDEGMEYGTASVCIPPSFVKRAKEYVGNRLAVCTVIGFPNGYMTTAAKVFETEDAVKNGADEIDMVINIGMVKEKDYDGVLAEIRGIKEACRSLFKREYEEIHALDHISFQIGDGEMVGYIGKNGAGKSSTIKVLSGILTPDEGTCVVNGKIPWKDRISYVRDIGVVFGQRSQLWWDVPVIDSFELLRDIYSIPNSTYRNNLEELTVLLDLKEILKTPARQLSLGQRMRCEIAASLLDRKSTRLNSSHIPLSRMPSSA